MTQRKLIEFCLTLPGVYEDYPFGEDWTVIRHGATRKGFAFVYTRNERLCVNLKCDPFEANFLRQLYRDLTPAYHMNKTHWNTVTLGAEPFRASDVPEDELRRMIERSYDLIRPKLKHRK